MDKRARYTPNFLPSATSVASEKYVINLATPYYPTQVLVINYDNTNTQHAINKDKPVHNRVKWYTALGDIMVKYATKNSFCVV